MVGKQSRRAYLTSMGAAATVLGSAERVSAAPKTVIVPDDQPTIQDGVDAVRPGGTVEVKTTGSPYSDEVHIGKPVTIVGDPGEDTPGAGKDAPVIDGGGAVRQSGFKLYRDGASPDNVIIRGFEIRNFGERPDGGRWGHGVSAGRDNTSVAIQDCTIHDVGAAGISVTTHGDRRYRNWTVERCRFENCPLAGVRFDHVSDATVRNNAFRNPSPTPDDYPRTGVYLHANTRNGESETQSNVDVIGNDFRGDSKQAAVRLLAINKNPADSDTLAALRDVRVVGNTFAEMSETGAVLAAANSVHDADTRLSDVEVSNNTVTGALDGFEFNSDAVDGISDITVANNHVSVAQGGLAISGRQPAAITGVISRENSYSTDIDGVFVPVHERQAPDDDDRYAVNDIRVVGDDIDAGDHWGIGVHSNQPRGFGSLTVKDVHSTGKEGIHVSGHAPDAVDSVSVSESEFKGLEGVGIHFSGEADSATSTDNPFLGQVTVTDVSGVGADQPGLALTGKNGSESAPGIGSVTVDGLTVEDGPGVGVFGKGPDALGVIKFSDVTCRGLGGIDVLGRAPGAIHELTVDEITVDADNGQGVNLTGTHEAGSGDDRPAIGPVSVSNATFTVHEGAALGVHGEAPRALDSVDVQNLTVDATDVAFGGVGVLVHGRAPNATGTVSIENATLSARQHGILVDTEGGTDAAVNVNSSNVTIETQEGSGIEIRGREAGAIDNVDLVNAVVDAGANGIVIHGQAADAIANVALSSFEVSSEKEALYVDATPKSVGTISLDDFTGTTETYATLRAHASGPGAVGTFSATDLTLHDGWVGLWLTGPDADGFGRVEVTHSDLRRNEYGVALSGGLAGGLVRIRRSNFVDNQKPPESDVRGYGVANFANGPGSVDAKQNYWGHPNGPERPHPSRTNGKSEKETEKNGGDGISRGREEFKGRRGPPKTIGKGDLISAGVDVQPWLHNEV